MIDIAYYRRMKYVNRLSRWPISRGYNLLEHSFMVTVLFRHFANLEDISYDMQVLDRVMNHDIVETVTGDFPYDAKNMNRETKELWEQLELQVVRMHLTFDRYTDRALMDVFTFQQYELFKACDLLDLWIFIREEQEMGNRSEMLDHIATKCVNLIRGKFPSIDKYMNTYRF